MTAKELRALQKMMELLTSPEFRTLLAFFSENCPFVGKEIERKTAIIRNEGRMQGWLALLHVMREIHKTAPEKEPSTERRQLYPDPLKPSDQNK